ncbi:MAG TPA: hypothetical protein VK546_05595 [Gaiellales bacterium]|jgi:hypothetical protein|nr:hypothetical protein [Gaiellales bacterium]
MYVAIRRYENNAQLADRLVARRDEIQTVISEVAGFRAYYLLRSSDGTTSVTVCDDQEGAEESTRIAANWLRRNMPDAVSRAPQVTAGEAVIDF